MATSSFKVTLARGDQQLLDIDLSPDTTIKLTIGQAGCNIEVVEAKEATSSSHKFQDNLAYSTPPKTNMIRFFIKCIFSIAMCHGIYAEWRPAYYQIFHLLDEPPHYLNDFMRPCKDLATFAISTLAVFGFFSSNPVPGIEAFTVACSNIHQGVVELFLTRQPHVLGGFSAHCGIIDLVLGVALAYGLIHGNSKHDPPKAVACLIKLCLLLSVCHWWAKGFSYTFGYSVVTYDQVHAILFDGLCGAFIFGLGTLGAYAMIAIWLPSDWQRKPQPVPLSLNLALMVYHGYCMYAGIFERVPPMWSLALGHGFVGMACFLAILGVANQRPTNTAHQQKNE